MKTTLTILGCGSSSGVPVIGKGWGECDAHNLKNLRTRTSLMMQRGKTNLLFDTTPDFRQQALKQNIKKIDGVIYTHVHADHLHGINDLRWLNINMNQSLNIYGTKDDLKRIEESFSYVFQPLHPGVSHYYKPVLNPCIIENDFQIGDFNSIIPFKQDHGYIDTLGFRIDNVAYCTDVVDFPEESWNLLYDLDLWIVGCLQKKDPHTSHAHLEKVLDWSLELKPKRVILTHMGSDLDYQITQNMTPKHIEPAYDGMVIQIPLR